MALNLEAKKAVVEHVNGLATDAMAVGVAKYRGLSVEQMSILRKNAIEASVSVQVVKNTLARRALKKTNCECVIPTLNGPVLLGFSQQDPGAVARVFAQFAKEYDQLEVQGLGVSGEFIDADQLKRIANLPTKDQAISLVMALLNAPIEKLTRTLNEVPASITRVVSAVGTTKQ